MTTNDGFLLPKNQKPSYFIYDNSQNDNQYNQLNLNQSSKCPILIPVHSKSKTCNNKNDDSKVSDYYGNKERSQSWKKSVKISKFVNNENEEVKECWKASDSSNTSINNSTLSLHIEAYESSVKNVANDSIISTNNFVMEELGSSKKCDNTKLIFSATSEFVNQNPFEFPRQQKGKMSEPEVSQFKASQCLLNPNKASNKDRKSCRSENYGKFVK